MFLAGTHYSGKSIKHPLANNQPPLNPEDVKSLLAGDKSVIGRIIDSHMNLIISIASKYASFTNLDHDDLVSIGLVAAIEACHALDDEHIDILIISKVHQEIAKAIRRENKRQTKQLEDTPHPYCQFRLLMIEELISKSTVTSTERDIVWLRRLGYNSKEVAGFLKMEECTLSAKRAIIEKRFEELEHAG